MFSLIEVWRGSAKTQREFCKEKDIAYSKLHLPLFRQIERFKRAGIHIPMSTITDWVSKTCKELEALYEVQKRLVLSSGYLEGDETKIKVLGKDKKGKTHLGYHWVYRAPLENLVLFDYRPGRGREGPSEILKNYKGYLQTDGYDVYADFGNHEGITLVGCMAHACRKFAEAVGNDKQRVRVSPPTRTVCHRAQGKGTEPFLRSVI